MAKATFRIWRTSGTEGRFQDYSTEVSEGMVVLDAVHRIQAEQAPDLACRWNCKAGKCGSCSAEINGTPRLMCMTRLNELPMAEPVTVEPMPLLSKRSGAGTVLVEWEAGFGAGHASVFVLKASRNLPDR